MRNPVKVCLVIIDDASDSRELLSAGLAQSGVEIHTAADPEKGLDLIHRKRPQVVLTDLGMPKMSGIEVLERASLFDPGIDVVLMTGHPSGRDRRRCHPDRSLRLYREARGSRRLSPTNR